MITKTIETVRALTRHLTSWLDAAPQSIALTSSARALENDRRQIREIKQAIRKLHVVGLEKQAALQEIERLRRNLERGYDIMLARIQQNMRAICDRYAALYEAWTGEPLAAGRQPVPLDEDIVIGRGCRLAGMMAAALDVIIVTFLMKDYYGLFWALLGALVPTVCLTILMDKVITAVTRHKALRKSLYLIGRIFWPALFFSLFALLVILAERYVSGLSYLFTVVFDGFASLATLIVTPSLLLLGSSLLAMGQIYAWSLPMSRNFDQFLQQYADIMNERGEFLAEQRPQADKDGQPKPPSRRFPPYSLMLAFVLVFSGFLAGCREGQGPALKKPKSNQTTTTARANDAIVNIEIDRSGSVEPQAGHAAAQNLYQQLVSILVKMRATELRLRHFMTDGWSTPVTLAVTLPPFQEPVISGGGDYSALPNRIKDWERLKEKLMNEAQQQYQTDLTEALAQAKVTAALLDPATGKSATCTDVYGVLSRISTGRRGTREEVYIVCTDGYDTCSKGVTPPLLSPQGKVRVLIFVTTAVKKEGEGKRPPQQFASRNEALKKIAPWAEIVTANQTDLAEILRATKAEQATVDVTRE